MIPTLALPSIVPIPTQIVEHDTEAILTNALHHISCSDTNVIHHIDDTTLVPSCDVIEAEPSDAESIQGVESSEEEHDDAENIDTTFQKKKKRKLIKLRKGLRIEFGLPSQRSSIMKFVEDVHSANRRRMDTSTDSDNKDSNIGVNNRCPVTRIEENTNEDSDDVIDLALPVIIPFINICIQKYGQDITVPDNTIDDDLISIHDESTTHNTKTPTSPNREYHQNSKVLSSPVRSQNAQKVYTTPKDEMTVNPLASPIDVSTNNDFQTSIEESIIIESNDAITIDVCGDDEPLPKSCDMSPVEEGQTGGTVSTAGNGSVSANNWKTDRTATEWPPKRQRQDRLGDVIKDLQNRLMKQGALADPKSYIKVGGMSNCYDKDDPFLDDEDDFLMQNYSDFDEEISQDDDDDDLLLTECYAHRYNDPKIFAFDNLLTLDRVVCPTRSASPNLIILTNDKVSEDATSQLHKHSSASDKFSKTELPHVGSDEFLRNVKDAMNEYTVIC